MAADGLRASLRVSVALPISPRIGDLPPQSGRDFLAWDQRKALREQTYANRTTRLQRWSRVSPPRGKAGPTRE